MGYDSVLFHGGHAMQKETTIQRPSCGIQEPAAFLAGLADDFAALRADPVAWAEELAEREAWDVAFSDGIGDE